jgi:hypothetical protein
MGRRTFKTTTRILLNTSFCMTFWPGSAVPQEATTKLLAGESAKSVGVSGVVVTSELGLAALYYQQGDYVKAALTYRRIQITMENTVGPNHPSMIGVLRLLSEVNVDLGNYTSVDT